MNSTSNGWVVQIRTAYLDSRDRNKLENDSIPHHPPAENTSSRFALSHHVRADWIVSSSATRYPFGHSHPQLCAPADDVLT